MEVIEGLKEFIKIRTKYSCQYHPVTLQIIVFFLGLCESICFSLLHKQKIDDYIQFLFPWIPLLSGCDVVLCVSIEENDIRETRKLE